MISEVELTQKEKKSSQLLSLSSLPDEIIENILARISKWNYPNLSLVSKRFFSILSSPQLYKTRSHIGTTEPCLYIWSDLPNHSSPEWFALWMKPDEILTSNDEVLNNYSVIPLHSSSHSPLIVPYDSNVAIGSEIYVIGGLHNAPSSSVRILDCRSHTWRDAPNMTVARAKASAVHIDQKIYVMGGCCGIDESTNWFEVFDIKTQTWRALPSPDHELPRSYLMVNPIAFEGKLYVAAHKKDYTYEPKDGTWKVVREISSMTSLRHLQDWCVIENVMYSCNTYSGYLKWYNSEVKEWIEIKGLRELREHPTRGLRKSILGIVNFGGKLVVIWTPTLEQDIGRNRKKKFWFAKIALEKRHRDEIWGKTEWLNTVNTVPELYNCLRFVVVSI